MASCCQSASKNTNWSSNQLLNMSNIREKFTKMFWENIVWIRLIQHFLRQPDCMFLGGQYFVSNKTTWWVLKSSSEASFVLASLKVWGIKTSVSRAAWSWRDVFGLGLMCPPWREVFHSNINNLHKCVCALIYLGQYMDYDLFRYIYPIVPWDLKTYIY